ncbi:hypothetical protein [Burkholderia sp. lig30]|uniref:hypothetical protein n=1 Tax=Burkholderia sp. lig30 TaxID=1192124 RepID=UPI00128F9D1C|nr:hypothetical protein [Burkholderia sp. lig30]
MTSTISYKVLHLLAETGSHLVVARDFWLPPDISLLDYLPTHPAIGLPVPRLGMRFPNAASRTTCIRREGLPGRENMPLVGTQQSRKFDFGKGHFVTNVYRKNSHISLPVFAIPSSRYRHFWEKLTNYAVDLRELDGLLCAPSKIHASLVMSFQEPISSPVFPTSLVQAASFTASPIGTVQARLSGGVQ